MIVELAQIEVKADSVDKFEAGVRAARKIFLAAEGCRSITLWRSVEHEFRYRLVVEWETLQHHTVNFRQSAGFTAWRQLVQDCFASPPQVEHNQIVPLD